MIFRIECPYCKCKHTIRTDLTDKISRNNGVFYCESEERESCGKLFIYEVTLIPKIKYWKTEEVRND